jgi:hypothetical protein
MVVKAFRSGANCRTILFTVKLKSGVVSALDMVISMSRRKWPDIDTTARNGEYKSYVHWLSLRMVCSLPPQFLNVHAVIAQFTTTATTTTLITKLPYHTPLLSGEARYVP